MNIEHIIFLIIFRDILCYIVYYNILYSMIYSMNILYRRSKSTTGCLKCKNHKHKVVAAVYVFNFSAWFYNKLYCPNEFSQERNWSFGNCLLIGLTIFT